ncbi:MAG: PKD domain-containing protein, partial [Phaeodactylibacter sp.]|nr:PKD domain-containing protein [Phaeodactylibacter sp.]
GDSTLQPVIDEPGIYDLFIVNTLNGCTAQDAVLITLDGMPPNPCLTTNVQIACGDTSAVIGDGCPNSDFVYEWTVLTGTTISMLDGPTIEAIPVNGMGQFELFVTDTTNACTAIYLISVIAATNCLPDCVINFPDTLDCVTDLINLDATGSSVGPEFVYDWTALSGNLCGDTTTMFPCVDAPGIYQLTVLNTATNFSCTAEITVTEDLAPPLVDAGVPMPLSLNCSGDPVLLNGQGFPDTTQAVYQWTGPDPGCFVTSAGSPSTSVSCPGTYYLTVIRNDNGCSAYDSLVVSLDTLAPVANIPVPAPITCGNGNTLLQSTGSSTGVNILYTWTFNNQVLASGPAAITYLANQVGTYCLEVLNTSNNCVDVFCQQVIQDTDLPISDAGPNLAIDCTTPIVTINGSGSMGATYSYQWTATNINCIIGNANNLSIQANCPGTYTLTVTDLTTNCQSTSSMVVADSTQAPFVDAGADQLITCDSFQVNLNGTNSVQGQQYTYLWTAQPGNIVSGAKGLSPVVDAAGIYVLTIQNQNTGCQATDNTVVTLDAGIPVVMAGVDTVLSCAFPTISLEGSSSINTPSIVYTWEATQGGIIVGGGNTPAPEVAAAGLYLLTVTDTSNGCFASDSLVVGLDTIAPSASIIDTLPLEFNCLLTELMLDGSASLPAGSLSFSWDTDDGNILSGPTAPIIVVDTAGTYQLTVTNMLNGCVDSTTVTVTEDFTAPDPQAAIPAPLTCLDSMVVLDASASVYTGAVTVAWTAPPGSGLQIDDADQLIATVYEPSLYFVTLTYVENGCGAVDTVKVLEDRMPPDAVAASTGVFDCMDNLVTLSGEGSSQGPIFSYQWFSLDGGNVFGADGLYPEVDASGNYGLEVINWENGCRDTAYTFVEALAATIHGLELSIKEPDCYDGSDARIVIDSVIGGTPPFLYALDEGSYDVHIWYDYLEAGNYTLQVLDINGCSHDTTFLINNPEEVVVDLGPDVELRLGEGAWLEALVNLDSAAIDTVIWNPL